ncbi:MAG: ThuA domain-containing protein [Planctomycetaceae bacterium]
MNREVIRFGVVAILAVIGIVVGEASGQELKLKKPEKLSRVLVFSKAGWYRHPEIPRTNGWLVELGLKHGFKVDVTETPDDFTPERLAAYQVLVLNNSNAMGETLNDAHKKAIIDWYRKGNGIVGLHAALVHQDGWPWLLELGGCDFDSDSDFAKARVIADPSVKQFPGLEETPAEFAYSADWHNHTLAVTGKPGFQVLLRLDEASYEPVRPYFKERGGKAMGKDHPCAWTHESEGGRYFYTDLGHDLRSVDMPFGTRLVLSAIYWTAETPAK